MNGNAPLRLSKPGADVGFLMKNDTKEVLLNLADPALRLLTDFYLTPAISVLATTPIDHALTQMIVSGVRLLFVVDVEFNILGAITSHDIQGDKPLRYMRSIDCRIGQCSREDILVEHIMIPVQRWEVINYDQLSNATLADIVLTFKEQGTRHIIVVDSVRGRPGQVVRGLLSLTTLERALGANLEPMKIARSFSEIKHELVT
jgi:CBS-domain-containing membrane protein